MQLHFGVYGLIRRTQHVVLVHKARGPYAGLLDLPGGSPEPADGDWTATLAREIAEETGLALAQAGPWHEVDLLVTQDSRGREIELRHSGLWTVAAVLLPADDPAVVSSDTSGWSWVDCTAWRRLRNLSPLARAVLFDAETQGYVGRSAVE